MAINNLGIVFTARDLASGSVNRLNRNVQVLGKTGVSTAARFDKSMKRVRTGALLLGGSIIGLRAIGKATRSFADFEEGMKRASLTMGVKAPADLKKLEEAAFRASRETEFSPKQVTGALEQLGAAGLNSAESISTLGPTLGLASAGSLSTADAADTLTTALNAFGETSKNAGLRVDQLTRVFQLTKFQARDFNIAISQSAAQAALGNQSFESMLATLGLLRDAGNSASVSATAYREAIRRVTADQAVVNKLTRIGVNVIDAQTGKFKDFATITVEVANATAKMNLKKRTAIQQAIFGARGIKAFSAVLKGSEKLVKKGILQRGDQAGAHRRLVKALKGSKGENKKFVEGMKETTAQQLRLLKGSVELFKVMLGKAFAPILLPGLRTLISVLNKVIGVIEKIPGPVKKTVGQVLVFALAVKGVVGGIRLLQGAFGLLSLGRIAAQSAKASAAMGGLAAATAATGTAATGAGIAITSSMGATASGTIGQTRRMAALRKGFARNVGAAKAFARGIGGALPFIGIAVAGAFTLNQIIKRREEERKRKIAAVRKENVLTAKSFDLAAKAADRATQATLKSTGMLLQNAKKSGVQAKKIRARLEKDIIKEASKATDLAIKLSAARTGKRMKEARTLRIALGKQQGVVDALRIQQFRADAEVARRRIRFAKNDKERKKLARKVVAADFFEIRTSEKKLSEDRKNFSKGKVNLDADAQKRGERNLSLRQRGIEKRVRAASKFARRFGLAPDITAGAPVGVQKGFLGAAARRPFERVEAPGPTLGTQAVAGRIAAGAAGGGRGLRGLTPVQIATLRQAVRGPAGSFERLVALTKASGSDQSVATADIKAMVGILKQLRDLESRGQPIVITMDGKVVAQAVVRAGGIAGTDTGGFTLDSRGRGAVGPSPGTLGLVRE